MAYSERPFKDPRTVAREIPGVLDALFPQLTPGTVLYLNKKNKSSANIVAVSDDLIKLSHLKKSMLFEISYARGEQILNGTVSPDWDECLKAATERQRRYFDASIPKELDEADRVVAEKVGANMAQLIREICAVRPGESLVNSPVIPGYQWISSGEGDFSIGKDIVEVKCTSRNFGSADYRQILMYWLLSYAGTIESGDVEWRCGVLLNPRLNRMVQVSFDEIVSIVAAGRSKIEILELFSSVVGDNALKLVSEFKL